MCFHATNHINRSNKKKVSNNIYEQQEIQIENLSNMQIKPKPNIWKR